MWEEIAIRFRVSLGMAKNLLYQRRTTKDLCRRHRYPGRKARVRAEYGDKLAAFVAA